MDLLTQGLLGSALAQSGARSGEIRIATGVGFAAGLLADADALIRSSSDPLLTLEYHRHFSHSIFFIPVGALIAAIILWPLARSRLTFARLYCFSFLGYSLSGALDAFTSYGTHLFWPLSMNRTSWHMISILDPVFTLVLLTAVLVAFRKHMAIPARIGLMLAAAYMAVAGLQLNRAERGLDELLESRGHSAEKSMVKPTLGNIVLWRSIYVYQGTAYVDVIRVGMNSGPRIYQGGSIELFNAQRDLPQLIAGSTLHQDIRRFDAFSNGYIAMHPDNPSIIGDVRYANSPDDLKPLWGIEFDVGKPDEHVAYRFYRDLGSQNRQRFLSMLFPAGEGD